LNITRRSLVVGSLLTVIFGLAPPVRAQQLGPTVTIATNGVSHCVPMTNVASLGVAVTGTWSGQIAIRDAEAEDGTGGATMTAGLVAGDADSVLTSNGRYFVGNHGSVFICATSTSWTSGTATIVFRRGLITSPGSVSVGAVTAITDAELRASPVPVTGAKTTNGAVPGADNVGALVAISTAAAPTLTEGRLSALSMDNSGGLRVSGITSGGLTDAELRATAVPVSLAGAATAANQTTIIGHVDGLEAPLASVGAAMPTTVLVIGGENLADQTVRRPAVVDMDSSSGTEYGFAVNLRRIASGDSVEAGTTANPWIIGDGAGALNVIMDSGTLTAITNALPAGTNNIGDVDVLTLPALAAGSADIGNVNIEIGGSAIASTNPVAVRISDGLNYLTVATDATHDSAASATGPMAMLEFDDASPDAIDEGDAGRLRGSSNRNLYVTLRDAGGNERGVNVTASNELLAAVTCALCATQSTLTTGVTALQLIDDTIFVDEAAFTTATAKVIAIGAVAESTTDTLADGTVGAPVMTLARGLRTVPTPYLSGGGTGVSYVSAGAGEDEHAVCTGPCTLYSIVAMNHTAASAFLRCENDTAANTTPGAETNVDGEPDIEIPASTTGAGFVIPINVGVSFSTALTCWIVSGEAASDTTEVAGNDVRVWYVRTQ
jgi:hypothetical protein